MADLVNRKGADMSYQDCIRKGVELADGWQTTRMGDQRVKVFAPHGGGGEHPLRDIGYLTDQWVLDALASQLLRQANAEVSRGKFTSTGDSMDVIETIVRWHHQRNRDHDDQKEGIKAGTTNAPRAIQKRA